MVSVLRVFQSAITLLSLFCVLSLDFCFFVFPPFVIFAVPVDSCLKAFAEVSVLRCPVEFLTKLCSIDGIAHIMAGSIVYMLIGIFWFTHEFEDGFEDVLIVFFTVSSNKIGLSAPTFVDDSVNCAVVVVDVNPVTNVFSCSVEFRGDVTQDLGNLTWNELFDMLIRAVVV